MIHVVFNVVCITNYNFLVVRVRSTLQEIQEIKKEIYQKRLCENRKFTQYSWFSGKINCNHYLVVLKYESKWNVKWIKKVFSSFMIEEELSYTWNIIFFLFIILFEFEILPKKILFCGMSKAETLSSSSKIKSQINDWWLY